MIASFLVSLLMIAACNTTSNSNGSATEASISGIQWYLNKMYLSSGNIEVKDNSTFIKLDAQKKSAGGKGGCNSYGSSYKIDNNSISFKNLFSTKMFCEKYQQQENNFFSQLEKVNRFDVKEGKLLLYMDNELLLEFGK
jgi:heat shock protein HslJ